MAINWTEVMSKPNKDYKVPGAILLDFHNKVVEQTVEINELKEENKKLRAEINELKEKLGIADNANLLRRDGS